MIYLLSIDIKKNIGMDEGSTLFILKIFVKIKLITHHLENPCLYPKAIKK